VSISFELRALQGGVCYCIRSIRARHKKLNEVEGKERYRVEISNSFAAFETIDNRVDVNKI
jgi:hypothetical protein